MKVQVKVKRECCEIIKIRLPKGYNDYISMLAASHGQSVNTFIRDAIIERIYAFED